VKELFPFSFFSPFGGRIWLCSPGWPPTHDPPAFTSRYWDYRYVPPYPVRRTSLNCDVDAKERSTKIRTQKKVYEKQTNQKNKKQKKEKEGLCSFMVDRYIALASQCGQA
jgi:hypothetical protein